MIEGGRGSGKTMHLKYHCHKTRFSPKRNIILAEELCHVGLYFRPDTDFCAMINEFNFDTDWKRVFSHYVFINLLEELFSAVSVISKTTFEDISFESDILDKKIPPSITDIVADFPPTFRLLGEYLQKLISSFNLWLNDPDSFPRPQFLEPRTILGQLIAFLKSEFSELEDLALYIYFDEFENLTHAQQTVINSWMKHGRLPIIYNAAYKKGAEVCRDTTSNERLVHRNDYRIVDLDNVSSGEFKVFAAEVFSLKLMEATKIEGYQGLKRYFGDENNVETRRSTLHQEAVITIARSFLPECSYKEIAKDIINNESLTKRIEKFLISPALEESKFNSYDFIDKKFPEESLINGLLLNRQSYSPAKVMEMFSELHSSGSKKSYKSLVEQNLVGAILWVYQSASWRKCPIYTGFDRFCLMARGNMRHFLELCHQTLIVASRNSIIIKKDQITSIPIEIQSEAATNGSRLELEKIDELGRHGEQLRFIANRLGLFFQLIQKRKSQSETEVNHFSIKITDKNQLDDVTKGLINEAVLWSVLIELDGDTKRKELTGFTSKEYVLHPIYSPHFGISFRRKKKFEFTAEQIKTIFSGKEEDYVSLCRKFVKKWNIGIEESEIGSANQIQRGLWD